MPQTAGPQTAALSKPSAATGVPPVIAATAPAAPATATPLAAAKPGQLAAPALAEHHAQASADHGPVGRTQVQLAALATEAAARHEWERLAHRMPGVFGTHHPVFSKTERDGHTLWRVRPAISPPRRKQRVLSASARQGWRLRGRRVLSVSHEAARLRVRRYSRPSPDRLAHSADHGELPGTSPWGEASGRDRNRCPLTRRLRT